MPKSKTRKTVTRGKKASGTRPPKAPDWASFEARLQRLEQLCQCLGPSEDAPPIPRRRTALELASELLQHPGAWLRTPNPNLGNRKPIDLIDTDEEVRVFNLLNAVDQGFFS
jgi:hypothetical protein